ncbi:hypothetical protein ACFVU2_19540 [Leifsonia sp. NPDC058194]|uniref:hypothetical protein n=1 Tax=Leifsonia sp. NPDC058194 TaxID=3346374 RepID=UPI0036D81E71
MTTIENAAGHLSRVTRPYAPAERRAVGARARSHREPLLQVVEAPKDTRTIPRLPLEVELRLRRGGADPWLPVIAEQNPGFKIVAARYAKDGDAAVYTLVPED